MRGREGGGGVVEECVCEGSDARVAHLCPAAAHDCLHVLVAASVSHSTWLATVGEKDVSNIILNPPRCSRSQVARLSSDLRDRCWTFLQPEYYFL